VYDNRFRLRIGVDGGAGASRGERPTDKLWWIVPMRFKTSTLQTGFTLIEVMVVVVILGILASIVIPRVINKPEQARVAKAKQDIRSIESALNLYRLDNYTYPTTDQGLQALVKKPSGNPQPKHWEQYLDRVPKDPWGDRYQYLNPGTHGKIDIYTLGADDQPGGKGANADIGNWDLNQ
jgi:general secretion pathway protein G